MHDRLAETLRSSHYSLTQPRRVIFDALIKSGPTTTANLSQKCVGVLDRATVYRNIALFEQLGIINRVWHGFKSQLELSEIFTPHHHHAVCQSCGRTIDIINSELENAIARISREHHFLALGHAIELTGYCQQCQLEQ